ncbi:hypothetical protein Goklo_006036 [Gossypium klotzschianum]|uniref:Uncharacterized protein n=1 Tax=Gossypium klotzschianum TaxID=34286 RepID=A0A7J8VG53_9ROSI|nr:hypothetical protein [Gossypium klotzschianum]
MGPYSLGPFNLLIGELYATIFCMQFQIIFMEVESRWAGYETYSRSWGMIRLKSHWSTMLLSRCTRWIECCGNLDFNNQFP